jgi:hypothetical protein
MNVFHVLLQSACRWVFRAEPQINVSTLNAPFHFLHNKHSTSEIMRNINKEEFILFFELWSFSEKIEGFIFE